MVEEVKTVLNRDTYTTRWRYDNQDRVKQMFCPKGELVDIAYNIQRELVRIKRNALLILAHRTYNENGRVIKEYLGDNTVRNYQYRDWVSTSGVIRQIQTGLSNIANDFGLQYLPL